MGGRHGGPRGRSAAEGFFLAAGGGRAQDGLKCRRSGRRIPAPILAREVAKISCRAQAAAALGGRLGHAMDGVVLEVVVGVGGDLVIRQGVHGAAQGSDEAGVGLRSESVFEAALIAGGAAGRVVATKQENKLHPLLSSISRQTPLKPPSIAGASSRQVSGNLLLPSPPRVLCPLASSTCRAKQTP